MTNNLSIMETQLTLHVNGTPIASILAQEESSSLLTLHTHDFDIEYLGNLLHEWMTTVSYNNNSQPLCLQISSKDILYVCGYLSFLGFRFPIDELALPRDTYHMYRNV